MKTFALFMTLFIQDKKASAIFILCSIEQLSIPMILKAAKSVSQIGPRH